MAVQVRPLETIVRRAPLGLRFQDLARGLDVTDGLAVSAWPIGSLPPGAAAERSPLSGIYGFRTLDGLRDYEIGLRPASDWCVPADAGVPNFIVQVEDRRQRFLPQAMRLCLPREHVVTVPLFSAPGRAPLPGMAAVYGQVWQRVADAPAPWPLVSVTTPEADTYVAIGDVRGAFLLFVPYASALPPLAGDPGHGSGPIDQLTWPLTVTVACRPATQTAIPGAAAPDIGSLLAQAGAQLYATAGGPAAATITRTLHFGQDLLLATDGLAPPAQSRLLIDPA